MRITIWIQGLIVFRIRHYCVIRKVVNRHSFILIRQVAALVRRALAEVCTVAVLLVTFVLFYVVKMHRYDSLYRLNK